MRTKKPRKKQYLVTVSCKGKNYIYKFPSKKKQMEFVRILKNGKYSNQWSYTI